MRCAILLLTLAAACHRDQPKLPEQAFLQPYPGSNATLSPQREEAAGIEYEISVPYPAEPVLRFISSRIPPEFKPREEDFMNPGIPTAHKRGWTDYGDSTTRPPTWVHHWGGEWEDAAGNIITYDLLYRSPAANRVPQPTSTLLRVVGQYLARELVDEMKASIPPQEKPVPSTAPAVAAPNPQYLVVRPMSAERFPGAREAVAYDRPLYFSETEVIVDLSDMQFQTAEASEGSGGTHVIFVNTNAAGDEKLRTWTTANVGKTLGIFLDGRLISAPTIETPISGTIILEGGFSAEQARQVVERIRRGGT